MIEEAKLFAVAFHDPKQLDKMSERMKAAGAERQPHQEESETPRSAAEFFQMLKQN